MWFDKKDLTIKPIIKVDNLHGYVLPHAGTSYTGEIISHTLRFRPTKKIKRVIILYYPSTETPDSAAHFSRTGLSGTITATR